MTKHLQLLLLLLLLELSVASRAPHSSTRRIVGGEVVSNPGRYPWFAQLSRMNNRGISCGMSMIGPRWGMTACHCVIKPDYSGYYPGPGSAVTVGCADLTSKSCSVHTIKRWVPHPCYAISCCDDHDDLCLAELDEPVDLPGYAPVAGLHGRFELPPGSPVVLLGMGSNDRGLHGTLMEVSVNVASQSSCEAAEPKAINQHLINFENVICTGGTVTHMQ